MTKVDREGLTSATPLRFWPGGIASAGFGPTIKQVHGVDIDIPRRGRYSWASNVQTPEKSLSLFPSGTISAFYPMRLPTRTGAAEKNRRFCLEGSSFEATTTAKAGVVKAGAASVGGRPEQNQRPTAWSQSCSGGSGHITLLTACRVQFPLRPVQSCPAWGASHR